MGNRLAIAFQFGVLTGGYLSEYAKDSRYVRLVRSTIGILGRTPSVVFGMVTIVVYLGIRHSPIRGCTTPSYLILPVIIKTTEEAIRLFQMRYEKHHLQWARVNEILLQR